MTIPWNEIPRDYPAVLEQTVSTSAGSFILRLVLNGRCLNWYASILTLDRVPMIQGQLVRTWLDLLSLFPGISQDFGGGVGFMRANSRFDTILPEELQTPAIIQIVSSSREES